MSMSIDYVRASVTTSISDYTYIKLQYLQVEPTIMLMKPNWLATCLLLFELGNIGNLLHEAQIPCSLQSLIPDLIRVLHYGAADLVHMFNNTVYT